MTDCSAAAKAAPIDSATRKEVVEGIVRELNARYVFPEMAAKVGALLGPKLEAGEYETHDDPVEFSEQLTRDVQAVTADKHIRVRYYAAAVEVHSNNDDRLSAEQLMQYRVEAESRNFGVERVERLPLNIGYIDLRRFEAASMAGEAVAAAMTLVAHAPALIVDLRNCVGGDPATVALVSSYLFDERTHLNSIYQREGDRTDQYWTLDWVPGKRFGQLKPVYVLTSERTFSGAEEFSYDLQSLQRATVVGETTRGGAHPGGPRRLTPHFEVFVPDGRSISPITHSNWEGTGVEPDVKVQADDALRVAQILALKKLAEVPGVADVSALNERIGELESR